MLDRFHHELMVAAGHHIRSIPKWHVRRPSIHQLALSPGPSWSQLNSGKTYTAAPRLPSPYRYSSAQSDDLHFAAPALPRWL